MRTGAGASTKMLRQGTGMQKEKMVEYYLFSSFLSTQYKVHTLLQSTERPPQTAECAAVTTCWYIMPIQVLDIVLLFISDGINFWQDKRLWLSFPWVHTNKHLLNVTIFLPKLKMTILLLNIETGCKLAMGNIFLFEPHPVHLFSSLILLIPRLREMLPTTALLLFHFSGETANRINHIHQNGFCHEHSCNMIALPRSDSHTLWW